MSRIEGHGRGASFERDMTRAGWDELVPDAGIVAHAGRVHRIHWAGACLAVSKPAIVPVGEIWVRWIDQRTTYVLLLDRMREILGRDRVSEHRDSSDHRQVLCSVSRHQGPRCWRDGTSRPPRSCCPAANRSSKVQFEGPSELLARRHAYHRSEGMPPSFQAGCRHRSIDKVSQNDIAVFPVAG
jgi:hypothetical protein